MLKIAFYPCRNQNAVISTQTKAQGRCSSSFVGYVTGPGNLYLLQKFQTLFRTQQTYNAIGAGVSASGVKWMTGLWMSGTMLLLLPYAFMVYSKPKLPVPLLFLQ